MWTLHDRYDKNRIGDLPRVEFPGRIFVVLSEGDAARAVDYLLRQPVLGFDTETKPSFRRGQHNKVALLQVSSSDTAFLFRLCRMGLPDAILRLLSDEQVVKVGLSLKDDFLALSRWRAFEHGPFIELQEEVKRLGIEDMSLQKLYANLFGERICKNQQLSNWEAPALSEAQQQYAAIDAWACVRLHQHVQELIETGDYELIRHEETIPEAR